MFNRYYFVYLVSVFVSSFSQILLKKSAMKQYSDRIREYLNVYVVSAYLLLFLSLTLTIVGFKGMAYKSGMILESLGNVIVLLLSCIFFKEKAEIQKVIGIFFVLCGFVIFYL